MYIKINTIAYIRDMKNKYNTSKQSCRTFKVINYMVYTN